MNFLSDANGEILSSSVRVLRSFLCMILLHYRHNLSLEECHMFNSLFMCRISRSCCRDDVTQTAKKIIVRNQTVSYCLWRSSNQISSRPTLAQTSGKKPTQRIFRHIPRRNQKVRRNLECFGHEKLAVLSSFIFGTLLIIRDV